jgi:hypothetical protein
MKKHKLILYTIVIFLVASLAVNPVYGLSNTGSHKYIADSNSCLSPKSALLDGNLIQATKLISGILDYLSTSAGRENLRPSHISRLFNVSKSELFVSISFGRWNVVFYDPADKQGLKEEKQIVFTDQINEHLAFTVTENESLDISDSIEFYYFLIHNITLDYQVLENITSDLSIEGKHDLLNFIDNFAGEYGLHLLNLQERHVFCRLIESVDSEFIDKLKSLDQDTKREISHKERVYTNVAVCVMAQMIREGTLQTIDITPLKNGPAIVFVIPPQPKGCIIVPPIGTNLVASFLQKLGVDVRMVDLSLDENMSELKKTICELGPRLKFISFGGSTYLRPYNFPKAVGSIYKVRKLVDELGVVSPVFIAGGMGFSYMYKTYLQKTPIEMIIRRFGSKCLAQMIFEVKTEAEKDLTSQYRDIKNLYIRNGGEIHETEIVSEDPLVLLVEGYGFNSSNIDYAEYFKRGYFIDICPTGPVGIEPDRISGAQQPPKGIFPLNVMDGIWGVLVSYIGSCTRKCKGCIFSQFSEDRISFDAMHLLDQLKKIHTQSPDMTGVGYIDDDFLVSPHLDKTLRIFGYTSIARLLSLYMETSPSSFMGKGASLLLKLRDAGFNKISFGVENPVTPKVLCDLHKIGDVGGTGVFKLFQEIPTKCAELGIATKATMILFWPSITQEELFKTMEKYLEFINKGINISIFPYLQIREGTPVGEELPKGSIYQVFDIEGNRIEHWDKVLPEDPEVRRIADFAMKNASRYLKEIVERYELGEHYHPQIIVLALMKAVLNEWKDKNGVPGEIRSGLDNVLNELEKTIEKIAKESKYGLVVRNAVEKCKNKDSAGGWELIKPLGSHSLIYLKRYIDFGTEEEKVYVLGLLKRVFSEMRFPVDILIDVIHDPLRDAEDEVHLLESILHSVKFLLRHPSLAIKEKALEVILVLPEKLQKDGFDMNLDSKKILVNGLGVVGEGLVSVLRDMGFRVYVSDVDTKRVDQIVGRYTVNGITKEDISCGKVKFDLIVDAASAGQGRDNKEIYNSLGYAVPVLYQGGEEFTIAKPFVFDTTACNIQNVEAQNEFRVENCNMTVSYLLLSSILKELGAVDIEDYYDKSSDFENAGAEYAPYSNHDIEGLMEDINPELNKHIHSFQSYKKSGNVYGYHLHRTIIKSADRRKRAQEIEKLKRLLIEGENGFRILVIDENESKGWEFEDIIKDVPERFKDAPVIPVRIRDMEDGAGIVLEYAVPHRGIAVPDNILLMFLKLGLDINFQSLALNKYLIEIEKKKELLRTYINSLLSFKPHLSRRADDASSYKVIKDDSVRDFLLHSARRIVEESRRLGIKTIFLNGESAKPAGELVMKYWQAYYPWDMPKIYYLKGVQQVSSSPRIETGVPGDYNESEVKLSVSSAGDSNEILSFPVLILEEGTVYGKTLEKSRDILKEMGAKDVYTGTLIYNPRYGEESIGPDIIPVGELTPKQWIDLSWNWYLRKHGTRYFVEHGKKPDYYVYHLAANEPYFNETMAELEQFFADLYEDFGRMIEETREDRNALLSSMIESDFYKMIQLYWNLQKFISHKEKEIGDSIKRAIENMIKCSGAKPGVQSVDTVQRLIRNWLSQKGHKLEWDYEFLMRYYLAIDSLFNMFMAKVGLIRETSVGKELKYLEANEVEKIKNVLLEDEGKPIEEGTDARENIISRILERVFGNEFPKDIALYYFLETRNDVRNIKELLTRQDKAKEKAEEKRSYVVEFDARRFSAIQQDLIKKYLEVLSGDFSYTNIEIKPFTDERGYVIKIDSKKESRVVGTAQVDLPISGQLEEYPIRIIGILNMAFAVAEIPLDLKESDIELYRPLIDYTKEQYNDITGLELLLDYTPESINNILRKIDLPVIEKISSEEVEEISKFAYQFLASA